MGYLQTFVCFTDHLVQISNNRNYSAFTKYHGQLQINLSLYIVGIGLKSCSDRHCTIEEGQGFLRLCHKIHNYTLVRRKFQYFLCFEIFTNLEYASVQTCNIVRIRISWSKTDQIFCSTFNVQSIIVHGIFVINSFFVGPIHNEDS